MVGRTGPGSLPSAGAARVAWPAGSRQRCGAALIACAASAAVAAPPGAPVPALDDSRPGWLQLETSLSVTPEILEARWTSLVRLPSAPPDYALAAATPPPAWANAPAFGRFVEMSPTGGSTRNLQAVYVRPQFVLGNSSDALRGWLRLAGIDATTCTAPLMRMHSAFAGSATRANVSLSARCSVH